MPRVVRRMAVCQHRGRRDLHPHPLKPTLRVREASGQAQLGAQRKLALLGHVVIAHHTGIDLLVCARHLVNIVQQDGRSTLLRSCGRGCIVGVESAVKLQPQACAVGCHRLQPTHRRHVSCSKTPSPLCTHRTHRTNTQAAPEARGSLGGRGGGRFYLRGRILAAS